MDSIKFLFTEIGVINATVTIFAAIFAFQSIINLIDWFCAKIGIETKWSLKSKQETEMIKAHEEILNKIDKDVRGTNDKLNVLSQMMIEMQKKSDASERARLKDRIAQAYRIFHERGSWTDMEKETFEDLIHDYEQHGGENSFIHSICEPESYTWKIIKEEPSCQITV